jgi:hypothetical protein
MDLGVEVLNTGRPLLPPLHLSHPARCSLPPARRRGLLTARPARPPFPARRRRLSHSHVVAACSAPGRPSRTAGPPTPAAPRGRSVARLPRLLATPAFGLSTPAARPGSSAARPSRLLADRQPSPPPATPARMPQHPWRVARSAAQPPSFPHHSRPPISPPGRHRQRPPSPGNSFSILYLFIIMIDKLLVVNSSLLLVNCYSTTVVFCS